MTKIYIDLRESQETRDILTLFLECEEKMLDVGDVIYNNTVCYELKQAPDFIASVFDGRLFRQISEMQENYPHSFILVPDTMANILQLAESVNRYSSILAAIASCYTRNCPIIFCTTIVNMADMIKVLGEKLTDGKVRSRPIEKTKLSDKRLQLICSFKGVNETRGIALLKHFGTVSNILNASSSDLQEVHNIGEVTADNMRAVLDS